MADRRLVVSSGPTYYVSGASPEEFDALGLAVEQEYEDTDVLFIRGRKSATLAGFFDEIGAVLQAPWYFGENWSALADILVDKGYLPGYLLLVRDAAELLADAPGDSLSTFISVFDKCREFYEGNSAAEEDELGFHIVFQATGDQLEPFERRLDATGAEFARL
jgi:hypothetical protein